ncbi:trihelix transcription factor ASIL2 isoform X1 [Jatropha curcas]|uniref:trihelix transcription factor ASIL2 isoform X1 n=1 Tax=Jatropha curcas TaxID=180498 RepID=UPI0009D6ACD5|nr:trihelix transcription factor ASIL2 isoform X1 [Jatropha curcas]
MGDLTDSVTPSTTPHSRPLPIREDCWSEEATSTLVEVWGKRYLELNRGNLRQKDWQEVADAVNAKHGHTKKTHRTDVQCKNRIDTIKKKYKIEKARVTSSNGTLTSSWPFFESLDALIGSNFSAKKQASPSLSPSPPVALPLTSYRRTPNQVSVPVSVPVMSLPQKRPLDDGYFRRNYSAMAAAAAAAAESESEEEEEEERERERERESEEDEEGEGIRRLARAIERFGEVYERVESEKLRQMLDLEKQRMKFAKDLEMERMRIFTETQIQLEKIKKGKRSGSNVEMHSQTILITQVLYFPRDFPVTVLVLFVR